MRKTLLILMLIVSATAFANVVGVVEDLRGREVTVSYNTRHVIVGTADAGFALTGRELDVFQHVSELNIDLAELASTTPVIYRQYTGYIASSNRLQRPIIFTFYSDGEDRQNIHLRIIERRSNSSGTMAFNQTQMRQLLNLLDEAYARIERLNEDISSLNEIAREARRHR